MFIKQKYNPERIKIARESRGLSQEALADKLGCTKQLISKYETGANIPSASNLAKICNVFECPVSFMYT